MLSRLYHLHSVKREHVHVSCREAIPVVRRFLAARVPPINHEVGARSVRARIRAKVHIRALELLGIAMAAHGDHAKPQLLHIVRDKVGQARGNIAGGDAVDARKVAPLVGQRARHVDAAGLGDVVAGLLLREVGHVAGHGARDDKGAGAALLEVRAHGLGAVEDAVEVDLDHVVPVGDAAVENAAAGRGARVGDEGVDVAEVAHHVGHQLLGAVEAVDLALVGLGLDAVLLGQLGGVLFAAGGARGVRERDVGAHFGAPARRFDAHAAGARGAGHDDDFVFEVEEAAEAVGFGDGDWHVEGGWWSLDGVLMSLDGVLMSLDGSPGK